MKKPEDLVSPNPTRNPRVPPPLSEFTTRTSAAFRHRQNKHSDDQAHTAVAMASMFCYSLGSISANLLLLESKNSSQHNQASKAHRNGYVLENEGQQDP